jgi:iron complex outermembrane receptor protein
MKKLFIALLFCSASFAQDSVYTLEPVEIIAARAGNNFQSFDVLDKNEIQYSEPGITLEESLVKIPGLIISDRNNPSLGDKISIRGIGSRSSFGVRGIKILVDNIPLTLPDGQSQTNNIDLFSEGRVEILKGPASSFYGNAAGGVINFQSEFPEEGIINITPQIIFGSYDLQRYSLKLSGQYNSQAYLISFNNLNYDGFREHSARKIYQLNTIYRNNFSGNFNITGVINYFNSPYLLNPGSLNRETIEQNRNSARELNKLQGTGEKATQFQSGLTLNFLKADFNFETTLYLIKRDLINPIPGRIINLNRIAGGLRSFFNKIFIFNNYELNFLGGVDIEFQNDLRKEFENNGLPNSNFEPAEIFKNLSYGNKLIDQKENVLGFGPFLSFKFLINENIGFLTGLRYDNYIFKVDDPFTNNSGKRRMSQFSPAVGLYFKPIPNSKIYFNYSTSFQTPTASELSNRLDAEGGFNPNLNPEKIYQFELGSEYFFQDLKTSISEAIYYLNFRDLIISYQVPGSEEIFFKNTGKAGNKGIEVMTETFLFDELITTFSYSLMDFVFKDYVVEFNGSNYRLEGNKIPGVPQQNFYFQIDYLNETGIQAKVKLHWIDDYFTNDFNGAPPESQSSKGNFTNESYFKMDLRLGYKFIFNFLNTELFLGINNLFDKKYNGSVIPNAIGERYFEPAPGRNFYAGLQIDY